MQRFLITSIIIVFLLASELPAGNAAVEVAVDEVAADFPALPGRRWIFRRYRAGGGNYGSAPSMSRAAHARSYSPQAQNRGAMGQQSISRPSPSVNRADTSGAGGANRSGREACAAIGTCRVSIAERFNNLAAANWTVF